MPQANDIYDKSFFCRNKNIDSNEASRKFSEASQDFSDCPPKMLNKQVCNITMMINLIINVIQQTIDN